MAARVVCPKCRKTLSITEQVKPGAVVVCANCGASLRLANVAQSAAKAESLSGGITLLTSERLVPADRPKNGPERIGQYRVLRELGRGSYGIVYQARDEKLMRDVAIKVLNPRSLTDADTLKRFLREAHVLGLMHHNNIVPVFQLDEFEGAPFIVSMLVRGQDISRVIPKRGMEASRATALVTQLLDALAYAHEEVRQDDKHYVVLHRDVKPANAMLDNHGRLYLMDFGLAAWISQDAVRSTRDGTVMGTVLYMAPEQAAGEVGAVGPAADQYSAAVMLFELLTGQVPFQLTEGVPAIALLHKIFSAPPPRPSSIRSDLDPRLEEICLKALAKKPGDRFASCREFAAKLRRWQEESGEPVLFEPVSDDRPVRPQPPLPADPRVDSTIKHPGPGTRTRKNLLSSSLKPLPAPNPVPGRLWLLAIIGAILLPFLGCLAYVKYGLPKETNRPARIRE